MTREYNENSEFNNNEHINLDIDSIKFNRVITNSVVEKNTKLTNLEVSTNRNYNTPIGIAHNGGKRKGSFAIYLEPWHSDVFEFIDLRKNHGKEEFRARDLFLAMWVPNLFMERVESDGDWSLFSPDEAPGLSDVYDSPDNKVFTKLYEEYESKGLARTTIKARKLMDAILTAQIETGTPYMLYKDHANYKSNQKNLGTIKSSNLCLSGNSVINVIYNDKHHKIDMQTANELFKSGVALKVLSFNLQTNQNEYQEIVNSALMNPSTEVLKITDDSGLELICTPDHQVYTENRGYVLAKDLLETDILKIIK